MKLPKYAIDNYQFTIMIFILLVIAGLTSYLTMPRTENPTIYMPGGSVVVIYPGASPNDLEQLVAIPIEEAINEIEDIKSMETAIRDGLVNVAVEFVYGTDAKEKYNEVVNKVNDIKNKLPNDIYSIETLRWSSGDINILQLALVSDSVEYYELEEAAERLKNDIEKINGIRKTELLAFPEREIRVSLDIEKMVQMNISIDQVASAIVSNNANIPGGSLDLGNRSFTVKTSGSYDNHEEIRNTVVGSYNGQLIYLNNIASVDFAYEDHDYIGRYNGHRAVFIAAGQKDDMNIFKIMDDLRPVIDEHRKNLEPDIQLFTVFDQSEFVDERINGFFSNLLQGILLVGVVILLAFGLKSSIIVILAIPFSFMTGLAFVDYSGFGLQQISIAGLVVSLGLLVDNSIVVIDNINRFLRNGHPPKEAAYLATRQIGWPVVSSTVTTVFAFIPIMMMRNDAGEFIKSLPVTITATLTMSLLIALTITPLIASLILKKPEKENVNLSGWLRRLIEGPYRKILNGAIKHYRSTILVAAIIFIVSVFIFIAFVGESFFPKAELPQMMIRVEMPEGTSLTKTNEVAMYVESVLDTIPLVAHYATNIGHGNPRIYYNMIPKFHSKNFAEIYVRLKKYDVREYSVLVTGLRKFFSSFPGGTINIKEFEQGTPVAAPVVIDIRGEELRILQRISEDVEKIMHRTEGLINIENMLNKSKTDLFVRINKDKAAYFGVPIIEIDKTVRTCINGAEVSKYRDKRGKEYNIILRLPVNGKTKIRDFDKIYVKSLAGKLIPLGQLVSIEFKEAPGIIIRKDLSKTATLIADIQKGFTLEDVLEPVVEELNNYHFPTGYGYSLAGELENRQESFGGMFKAIIIAIIAIFAVLVLQFRSFVQPLIMFVSIPLAFIGSIWAWYLTGNTFSFTAFIGLISLIGIVINNAIILVDYTNVLRNEGKPLEEAIKTAGETRFTPIILTTLTTIGGLLPLTLGGGTLWAPMGWGIIGGLITSTFLTLLVVPVLYYLVARTHQSLVSNGNKL
ncbi:MAG TPA: efflux RND transporter permease subunit [Bacteroidales bacterium]|nr:efflux RND transporter permease subunit [Bacteroidales bacterium]